MFNFLFVDPTYLYPQFRCRNNMGASNKISQRVKSHDVRVLHKNFVFYGFVFTYTICLTTRACGQQKRSTSFCFKKDIWTEQAICFIICVSSAHPITTLYIQLKTWCLDTLGKYRTGTVYMHFPKLILRSHRC